MTPTKLLLSIGLAVANAASALAADQVRLVSGGSKSGEITSATRDGVAIDAVDGPVKVPVGDIRFVILDNEPTQLTQGRINFDNGGYETAAEMLGSLDVSKLGSKLLRQEAAFYKAAAAARLAIGGAGDTQDAVSELAAFIREHGDSFHYYEVVETLGDLRLSLKEFDQAERAYSQLAKAAGIGLKARAALLVGRMLQVQGKHDEALKRFDGLIGAKVKDPGVVEAQRLAKLAKAQSLAATGDLEGGLNVARDAIRAADERDAAAMAAGYNALGRCYEAAQRPKDALFAFLHTDLLFNSDPATHAEALSHLGVLWNTAGKPEAGRDALARLQRQYAASPQARAMQRNRL
jgi:tetratricopeptide (TPR) repeat protein